MIQHDRSHSVILTKCTECGDVWFALRTTMDEARAAGERHDDDVHARAPRAVSAARRQADYRTRRHAVNS